MLQYISLEKQSRPFDIWILNSERRSELEIKIWETFDDTKAFGAMAGVRGWIRSESSLKNRGTLESVLRNFKI